MLGVLFFVLTSVIISSGSANSGIILIQWKNKGGEDNKRDGIDTGSKVHVKRTTYKIGIEGELHYFDDYMQIKLDQQ